MSSDLFKIITNAVKNKFTIDYLRQFKTKSGNTQSVERNVISVIRDILSNDLKISFEEAGSQQSKDFRNVGDEKINIEIKKTDGFTIMFNDTCPSIDIYYIILFTGKEYKTKNNIEPQVLCVNGAVFLKDALWIDEYKKCIETLVDRYGRGENKKQLGGCIKVYPRPNYSADIKNLLNF
tara:strand:+ start:366 stop:902 length:537 start_codon:yes stop_codon:yes gene_type:complete